MFRGMVILAYEEEIKICIWFFDQLLVAKIVHIYLNQI